jgi:hypothetical protein
MHNKKRFFFSFGCNGHTGSYRKRLEIISQEARNLGTFDDVFAYTDQDISGCPYEEFIRDPKNRRGFGYWLWKPYFIQQIMQHKMADGDILVYADSGCTVNPGGLERFLQYDEMLDANPFGLISFHLYACFDKEYCKRDLIDYMHTHPDDLETTQIIGTVMLFKKTSYSMEFVNRWLEIATMDKYRFIRDVDPQRDPEPYPDFQDHRHDQSIFSLLVKSIVRDPERAIKPIVLPDETYFPYAWQTLGARFPFWGTRHKD